MENRIDRTIDGNICRVVNKNHSLPLHRINRLVVENRLSIKIDEDIRCGVGKSESLANHKLWQTLL